jgi:small redox-active disulfide protein 2
MKNVSIQVLGSGCPTCKQLYKITKKIVDQLNIETEVEYITDVSKIIEMGVMSSPVLVINGKSVLTGIGHSENDIKKVLQENLRIEDE